MFPEWHHAVPESAYFKVPETLKTFRMYSTSRYAPCATRLKGGFPKLTRNWWRLIAIAASMSALMPLWLPFAYPVSHRYTSADAAPLSGSLTRLNFLNNRPSTSISGAEVHGTSDVVGDSIRTVIHHATVVIVVAVVWWWWPVPTRRWWGGRPWSTHRSGHLR